MSVNVQWSRVWRRLLLERYLALQSVRESIWNNSLYCPSASSGCWIQRFQKSTMARLQKWPHLVSICWVFFKPTILQRENICHHGLQWGHLNQQTTGLSTWPFKEHSPSPYLMELSHILHLQEETFTERSQGIWVAMNFPLTHRQTKTIWLLVIRKQSLVAMVLWSSVAPQRFTHHCFSTLGH